MQHFYSRKGKTLPLCRLLVMREKQRRLDCRWSPVAVVLAEGRDEVAFVSPSCREKEGVGIAVSETEQGIMFSLI